MKIFRQTHSTNQVKRKKHAKSNETSKHFFVANNDLGSTKTINGNSSKDNLDVPSMKSNILTTSESISAQFPSKPFHEEGGMMEKMSDFLGENTYFDSIKKSKEESSDMAKKKKIKRNAGPLFRDEKVDRVGKKGRHSNGPMKSKQLGKLKSTKKEEDKNVKHVSNDQNLKRRKRNIDLVGAKEVSDGKIPKNYGIFNEYGDKLNPTKILSNKYTKNYHKNKREKAIQNKILRLSLETLGNNCNLDYNDACRPFNVVDFFSSYSPPGKSVPKCDLSSFNKNQLKKNINLDNVEIQIPQIKSNNSLTEYIRTSENAEIDFSDLLNRKKISSNEEIRVEDMKSAYFRKTENGSVVILKFPAKLYIQGKIKASALCGNVEIYGYRLERTLREIYAPPTYFGLCFETLEDDAGSYGLFGSLTSLGIPVMETEDIVTGIGINDAVLYIEPLDKPAFHYMDKSFKAFPLFNEIEAVNGQYKIFNCAFSEHSDNTLVKNEQWDEFFHNIKEQDPVAIICGGNNVGKSTLLRYYVNKLLRPGPVLVIDLDIGQSEFTVPGNISAILVDHPIIGPNFTHIRQPNRMLHIGAISVKENLQIYMKAVSMMVEYCKSEEQFKKIPWLINTMGITDSMGLNLITFIIKILNPTSVVQIGGETRTSFSVSLDPTIVQSNYLSCKDNGLIKILIDNELNYKLIHLNSMSKSHSASKLVTPKNKRDLNVLAYFSQLVHLRTQTLQVVKPYRVSLNDVKLIMPLLLDMVSVYKVINGKILAMCSDHSTNQEIGKCYKMDDKPLICFGHGMVRGVDLDSECIYIITVVPTSDLHCVNTLVLCEMLPLIRTYDGLMRMPYTTEPPTVLESRRRGRIHQVLLSSNSYY